MNGFDSNIIHDEDASVRFAETTLHRTLLIYNEAYQMLKDVCCGLTADALPKDVLQRMRRMEALMGHCQTSNISTKA